MYGNYDGYSYWGHMPDGKFRQFATREDYEEAYKDFLVSAIKTTP